MKEIVTRAIFGLIYIVLLIGSLYNEHALAVLFFVFGIISIAEFKKLIEFHAFYPFAIFILIYFGFGYWHMFSPELKGFHEATQILLVLSIFVNLFLIKDLFSKKGIPVYKFKRFLLTSFYLSSSFIFFLLIARFGNEYNPSILLGSFILVWVNDTFAFLVGKNFGRQKLFEKISPKKTVEGFIGGLFFACIASYFIATFTHSLNFTQWLILAIIVSVFGTLGDLVESKFKRQVNVKDSGVIMPGHGGLMDRLDSIIFAAPFIYLFLRLIDYVS